MNTPITLRYHRRLVQSIVLTYWWHRTGWSYVAAMVVLAGSFLYFVANGDSSWFVGAIGTVLGFGAFLAGAMFLIRYRHELRRLDQMRPPEVTLVLSAEGFTISTIMSSATIRWSTIKEILECPNFWLLFLSSAQFVTVPTADVSRAELEIIRSHVVAAGGKVA